MLATKETFSRLDLYAMSEIHVDAVARLCTQSAVSEHDRAVGISLNNGSELSVMNNHSIQTPRKYGISQRNKKSNPLVTQFPSRQSRALTLASSRQPAYAGRSKLKTDWPVNGYMCSPGGTLKFRVTDCDGRMCGLPSVLLYSTQQGCITTAFSLQQQQCASRHTRAASKPDAAERQRPRPAAPRCRGAGRSTSDFFALIGVRAGLCCCCLSVLHVIMTTLK